MSLYYNIYVCIPKQRLVLFLLGLKSVYIVLCSVYLSATCLFLLNIIHEDLFILLLGDLLDSFSLLCIVYYMKVLPFIDSPVDRRSSCFWFPPSQAMLQ